MRTRKPKKQQCKPNVIPILDAVFIFIFFLLMSAQFLEIYEIGTDAPAVQTVNTEKKDEKIPLNLILDINEKEIVVKTGLDEVVKKKLSLENNEYNISELQNTLLELKKNNIEETSIILRPTSKVEYKKLIVIMDKVRELPKGTQVIVGKGKKGNEIQANSMFEQIIFETNI